MHYIQSFTYIILCCLLQKKYVNLLAFYESIVVNKVLNGLASVIKRQTLIKKMRVCKVKYTLIWI